MALDHTYRPNWNDKRVKARTKKVIEWVETNLRESQESYVSAHTLNKVFGPIGNKLGDFLRANLLIRSGFYQVGSSTYKYKLKSGSIAKIISFCCGEESNHVKTRVEIHRERFADELAKLEFNMNEQSNRYWHPLINLPRILKEEFWAPFLPFNYDINACAPTLLLQLAERYQIDISDIQPIQEYLNNREEYREHVSKITQLDRQCSKRVLNSLFNGAKLAKTTFCSTYSMLSEVLESDVAETSMEALQKDEKITFLRKSIQKLWKHIEKYEIGEIKSGKDKWALYFRLEKSVLDSMINELTRQGIKYFTEHDGFRTNRAVSISQLEEVVRQDTGFIITLSGQKDVST